MESERPDNFEDLPSLPEESPSKKGRGRTREEMLKMTSESKLTNLKRRELVKRIEGLILSGETKSSMFKIVELEFEIDFYYFQKAHTEARRNILRQVSTNMEDIRNTHVMLYEKIFKYFDESDYSFGKAKALQYKERLLGLHREDTFIEINNEQNTELIISEEDFYDTSQLTPSELGRLTYLKTKATHKVEKKAGKKERKKKALTERQLEERLKKKYLRRGEKREE